MSRDRHAVPDAGNLVEVQLAGQDGRLAGNAPGGLHQHPTPGVDDHRLTPAAALGVMLTDLGGGQYEALVLDRACPQEHLPMRFAGRNGEGGRDQQYLRARFGKRREMLGEAQVVANRQADSSAGVFEDRELCPAPCATTLIEHRAVREPGVEEVDLVVAGHELAAPQRQETVERTRRRIATDGDST